MLGSARHLGPVLAKSRFLCIWRNQIYRLRLQGGAALSPQQRGASGDRAGPHTLGAPHTPGGCLGGRCCMGALRKGEVGL